MNAKSTYVFISPEGVLIWDNGQVCYIIAGCCWSTHQTEIDWTVKWKL